MAYLQHPSLFPPASNTMRRVLSIALLVIPSAAFADPVVVPLWDGTPPGPPAVTDGPEQDTSKPDANKVAGKSVIRLGNVSSPEIHVFPAPAENNTGAACVVCPGGGFSILAWDLEGLEVAEWLNSIGVTAVVLKYRVPTRQHGDDNWKGPVIDAQRALSITRAHAANWKLDPARVGILGFSAGGKTAAMAALQAGERLYEATDDHDGHPCQADFGVLIYTAYLVDKEGSMQETVKPLGTLPPFFFAHAANDPVTAESSLRLCQECVRAKVPTELHLYPTGGHGYGLRPTEERVTEWPAHAAAFLKQIGMLKKAE